MGYDTRKYWNNKEKRAEKAREHTQLMEYYYGNEIKDVVEFDTKEYNDSGNIRPDIDMLKRLKAAQNEIKEGNITDK